ncbi:MAG: DUF4290 domain-containing protein [Saprospiraceae bacterium]|nr:DUF4290 domain-containing protein [Saprospiraceae bacterium]
MNNLDIEYNTERPDIQFPEYGRSIQEMLLHAKTIESPQKRQKTVESIIGLMIQLGPQGNRNMDDYREKLWNHVFALTNYELDVTVPAGIIIRREEDRARPQPLGYPITATRMRHYGNSVHALIQKAIEMPEGPKREGFVEVIASYMKLAYKTWNKEHYVSDDIVKEDLEILSNGLLVLHEGHDSLDKLAAGVGKLDNRNRTNTVGSNDRSGRRRGGRNRGSTSGSGGSSGGGRSSNSSSNSNNNSSGRRRKR